MSRQENDTGMPLQIWVGAISIALTLIISLYFFLDFRDRRMNRLMDKKTIIEDYETSDYVRFVNKKSNKIDFCFLGSSLLRNAMMKYHSFDSIIDNEKGNFNYKAIVCSGVNLQGFNYKISEIRRLRPRYLFIESNIACVNLYSGNKFTLFRIRLARIPEYFACMGSDAFKIFNKPALEIELEQDKAILDFGNQNFKADYILGEKLTVRKINEFSMWVDFYKEATRLGIKICLLEIPRSLEAEQHLPDKFKQEYSALIHQFQTQYSIGYIEFPKKIGRSKYYLDRAHFNKSGGDIIAHG